MNIIDIAIAKQLAGGGGGSGTDSYNDLSNLPKINDVTLSGNKSSSALGLQSEITSDSKLASDLVDDTNQDNKFVTSAEKTTWNGKQNAIDADHKINADYVDDSTSTNKFVTASDKETWNAKQNAIDNSHKLSSDLVDDANHTNKFVTSTEKNTWNEKQNAIDSEHKLSSSLVSFTTAEAAALASGIDSAKVAQISTNQSNILYTLNRTGKNCMDLQNPYIVSALQGQETYTNGDNGSVTITDTNTTWSTYQVIGYVKPNTAYKLVTYVSNFSSSVSLFVKESLTSEANLAQGSIQDNGTITTDITTGSSNQIRICYNLNNSATTKSNSITLRAMLVEASTYAIDSTYVPASLPNYDLTYIQAEDRAALAEEIDAGAKNKFNISGSTFDSFGSQFSVTYSGSSATIKQTGSNTGLRLPGFVTYLDKGTYVLSGCPSGGSQTTYRLDLRSYNGSAGNVINGSMDEGAGSDAFDITTAGNYLITLRIADGYTVPSAGITVTPMICTKAAFGVSNKFVPYRPNYDLVSSYTPKASGGSQNLTTEYTCFSGVVLSLPAGNQLASICRISCSLFTNGSSHPSGIIISLSNSSSDYQASNKMIAKIETSDDKLVLTAEGIYYNPYDYEIPVYFWAKAKTIGQDRMYAIIEPLRTN